MKKISKIILLTLFFTFLVSLPYETEAKPDKNKGKKDVTWDDMNKTWDEMDETWDEVGKNDKKEIKNKKHMINKEIKGWSMGLKKGWKTSNPPGWDKKSEKEKKEWTEKLEKNKEQIREKARKHKKDPEGCQEILEYSSRMGIPSEDAGFIYDKILEKNIKMEDIKNIGVALSENAENFDFGKIRNKIIDEISEENNPELIIKTIRSIKENTLNSSDKPWWNFWD